MVAQPGQYQASCNGGELQLELKGRTDIKQFYSGLSLARNIEPVPQAGARLSPRTRLRGRFRHVLEEIANAASSTSLGPHAGAATIVSATFSVTPRSVCAVRFDGFAADVPVDGLMQVEVLLADATWQAFGAAFSFNADALSARTRMVAVAPGSSVEAFAMRLRLTGTPGDPVTFTLAGFATLAETPDLSAVRLRPFTFERSQSYLWALFDNYADIWRDGEWVGMVSTAIGEDRLRRLDMRQRFDTALLYHRDVKPQRVLRDAGDAQWLRDDTPFTDIPQVDLGGTYTNQVTDKWAIYLSFLASGDFAQGKNLSLSIKVNGEETGAITVGDPVVWNDFAADVKAAIEALPSVGAGITVTASGNSRSATVEIEFVGADNLGNVFEITAAVINTSDAAATVGHTQIGEPGGEDLFGTARGYPACANFYQDRQFTAGFKAKRSAFLASASGEYFDLNTKVAADSGSLLHNVDTEGAEEILALARARHLVIFTSEGEYFISDRAISRNTTPNVVSSSRNGSAPGVPIIESEAQLLYLAPDRSSESDDPPGIMLYSMTYDDVAQAYVSTPISLLASHIVRDVIDAALQKASTSTDANRLWMVRSDGTMTEGVLIRNQDVGAFVRWETAGQVKAAAVDGKGRCAVAVQRMTAGAAEIYLEELEDGLIFDAVIEQDFDTPQTVIPNLGVHEGAEVWAKADGFVVGPFTVAAAAITLTKAASNVQVGRWTPPDGQLLPIPREIAERTVVRRPCRVHTVKIDLIDTTSVAIGANGRAAKDQPLYFAGQPTDAPVPPFSGLREVYGLKGFSDEGIVQITQTKPGFLQWRGITVEARI